jgi:hypothetical protein
MGAPLRLQSRGDGSCIAGFVYSSVSTHAPPTRRHRQSCGRRIPTGNLAMTRASRPASELAVWSACSAFMADLTSYASRRKLTSTSTTMGSSSMTRVVLMLSLMLTLDHSLSSVPGRSLVEAIERLQPDVKALVYSGYTEEHLRLGSGPRNPCPKCSKELLPVAQLCAACALTNAKPSSFQRECSSAIGFMTRLSPKQRLRLCRLTTGPLMQRSSLTRIICDWSLLVGGPWPRSQLARGAPLPRSMGRLCRHGGWACAWRATQRQYQGVAGWAGRTATARALGDAETPKRSHCRKAILLYSAETGWRSRQTFPSQAPAFVSV